MCLTYVQYYIYKRRGDRDVVFFLLLLFVVLCLFLCMCKCLPCGGSKCLCVCVVFLLSFYIFTFVFLVFFCLFVSLCNIVRVSLLLSLSQVCLLSFILFSRVSVCLFFRFCCFFFLYQVDVAEFMF